MELISTIMRESWHLLQSSSIYILFGILIAGMLRAFLNPAFVANHLGSGRFSSVIKASLLGIPIPLCSCGVIPAAASLKKQGANNGATTAFLISTPESGVDSIAITYALLDPIITVARPVAAFFTATIAGFIENLSGRNDTSPEITPDLTCPIDRCCDGRDCLEADHSNHHTSAEKISFGMRYAFGELWDDLAVWFFIGIALAGIISAVIPENFINQYLGGGLSTMIIMLLAGIPMYICATASTPIAAALILKGISPGAALVFLLAGPATNITSLTMVFKILGKRSTLIYLTVIMVLSVIGGLSLDLVYSLSGVSARAVAGSAGELIPLWAQSSGAFILMALSIKPFARAASTRIRRLTRHEHGHTCSCRDELPEDSSCCSDKSCSTGHDRMGSH
jgi:uncharacterized membrane protein YraQ (UPF0718 family)